MLSAKEAVQATFKAREEFAKKFRERVEKEIQIAIEAGELDTRVFGVPIHTIGFVESALEPLEQLGYECTVDEYSPNAATTSFYIGWRKS